MTSNEQPEIESAVFKPGQVAKQSGIYRADHRRHKESHEVTALRGERFPSCDGCSYGVSYTLVRLAAYIYGNI
jgi:hypothetical protein